MLMQAYKSRSKSEGNFIWANSDFQMSVVKDKDVLSDVRETRGIGFVGSDVTSEIDAQGLQTKAICVVSGLRYALLAKPDSADATRRKFVTGEPLVIGTSYPIMAAELLGEATIIGKLRHGSIEGLPWRFPWLDAIFELVRSGDSAVANGLSVVADDLATVSLMKISAFPANSTCVDVRQIEFVSNGEY